MSSKVYTTTALIIGIVIVLNMVSQQYHARFDLTEDREFTLSQATETLVADLEEPVTVKAYFSADLPPHIRKTREDFQNLLIEYASLSGGQVIFEFINPNESESIEQEAVEQGIRPVLLDIREKDQMRQQKAFLGATVELGEQKEVIPFIQPGAAMEYALTTAIKKISVREKPAVGFITGHGEPTLAEMSEVVADLNILYSTTEVLLTDTTDIPANLRTLALIRPMDSIPASHFTKLDAFLARGGNLLIAINRVNGDFRSFYGTAVNTGLELWLKKKGVEVADNFVADAQCGSFTMPRQLGAFTIQAHVSFPYVPIVSTFSQHPAVAGLESVLFEFPSEIKFSSADSAFKFTPLAFSSELSATFPAPQFFDVNKEWQESDFDRKHVPVAAALEGKLAGNNTKIVIVSDGDFPVNGPPQQQRRLQ
ncbi:MAG TPA: GldG family protein, partial [Chryseosolibacter sp.]|nr:GldG family protein [Chryseosolibacter sp.]